MKWSGVERCGVGGWVGFVMWDLHSGLVHSTHPVPQSLPVSRAVVFSHALCWTGAREWNITGGGGGVKGARGHILQALKANRTPEPLGTPVFTLAGVRDHFRPQTRTAREREGKREGVSESERIRERKKLEQMDGVDEMWEGTLW